MDTEELNNTLTRYSAISISYEGGFGITIEAIARASLETKAYRFFKVSNYTHEGTLRDLCHAITHFDREERNQPRGYCLEQAQKLGITKRFFGGQP